MKEIFVQSEKTIKVSKNQLLEEIRKPGNLVNFHPFCKENHVEKWSGEGSIDYVKYLNDLTYKRKFLEWNDSGYALDIGVDGKLAHVRWLVKGDKKSSTLNIKVKPIIPFKNTFIRWLAWTFYIKPKLQAYLNSVVGGLKLYMETNKPVERNIFGKHAWYS